MMTTTTTTTTTTLERTTYPDMAPERVLAEAGAHLPLVVVGGFARSVHHALDDDVPGQQTHLRPLVHVVREVAIVTVAESPWSGKFVFMFYIFFFKLSQVKQTLLSHIDTLHALRSFN